MSERGVQFSSKQLASGLGVFTVLLSFIGVGFKLQYDVNAQGVRLEKVETTATQSQHSVPLIQQDVQRIQQDVQTIQTDLKSLQVSQQDQRVLLSQILVEVRKTNHVP